MPISLRCGAEYSPRMSIRFTRGQRLNQNTGDWHRGALTDTARVVTPLEQSARTFCADNDDSGYSPCGASLHAGRTAAGSLWLLVGPALVAAVCRGPLSDGNCGCAVL